MADVSFRTFLKRPEISAPALSALIAVYFVAALNLSFWTRAYHYADGRMLTLAIVAIGSVALFTAVLTALSLRYIAKPVFITLIIIGALASWSMDTFGQIVDLEIVRSTFETTGAESGQYFTPSFIGHLVLYGLVPSLLVAWVKIRRGRILPQTLRSMAVIAACVAIAGVATVGRYRDIASTVRNHKDLQYYVNPVTPITNVVRYFRGSRKPTVIEAIGLDAKRRTVAAAPGKPRVTVIVVGETARAANFSLGGYARETNPELKKRDIVYFTNATSCGTATSVSLPCMFSVYTRAQYSHRKGLGTQNLIDVLSHAGIKAQWLDNNTGSKGVADRISSGFVLSLGGPFCSDRECRDDAFLAPLAAWLDQVTTDSVLVIHQIGSHGPAYYDRYSDEYRRFTPDCRTSDLTKCPNEEIVNAYDNTILYTDQFLAKVIDDLRSHSDKLATSMIYMSDHGESLGENNLYLHGTPYMFAPKEQTHIPAVLWMDDDFARSAGVNRSCIAARANEAVSHDNLFHTVLSMMNVSTSVYDPKLDIFAPCRSMARN